MVIYRLDAISFLIDMFTTGILMALIFPLLNKYVLIKLGRGYKKMLGPCDGKHHLYLFFFGCTWAIVYKAADLAVNSLKHCYYVNRSDFQGNERAFFYIVILVYSVKMIYDIFAYFQEKEKEKD